MVEIFTHIDQLKEHVDIGALKLESLKPYFKSAESKFMAPYISQGILDDYKSNSTTPQNQALKPFLRKAFAHFVLLCAAPDLDINLSETGFTTSANNNLVPASEARVKRFVKNQKELGFTALNDLISYLHSNIADYPIFAASQQFQDTQSLIMNSMNTFQDCVDIKHSWLLFQSLLPKIKNVELLMIAPVISQDYINALISRRKSQTLTIADKDVLPFIYRAIANYVFEDTSTIDIEEEMVNEFTIKQAKEKSLYYKRMGDHFITEVRKKLLLNTATNYPEYYNSSQYDDSETFEKHNNTQDNGVYFFGL